MVYHSVAIYPKADYVVYSLKRIKT